ncbi:MAG: U32 family peptidase [Gammaproteobacteria bacterium]|nr:U32 family peptidase [Gammaproteobacteria bacterium]MDE2346232.1 U32 family peptidase [Gammaproteobacteria bacterium]
MKISLGPVLYYWPRELLLDFYARAAGWPVDTIYLGETVCSKRRALRTAEWIELAREISRSGKQAVLSTLSLIEAESELSTLARLCDNGELLVEANDMAAVHLLNEKHLPFAGGHALNIYNSRSLNYLQRQGMIRWTPPVELPRATLAAVLGEAAELGFGERLETEVFAFGHMPLAYSARCFTARASNLQKDSCEFECLKYPDGLPVYTQDDKRLLTLNGIQSQSGQVLNLLTEWQDMQQLGVRLVRISPLSKHLETIIEHTHTAIHEGRMPELTGLIDGESCNGYWFGQAGHQWVESMGSGS